MERVEYAVQRVTQGGEVWHQPYLSRMATERECRDGVVVRRIVTIGVWMPASSCVIA